MLSNKHLTEPSQETTEILSRLYRRSARKILASLIRLLGDFDLAEDALQEAFFTAAQVWPERGVPENPEAWLVSTGRFRAIDVIRRRKLFRDKLPLLAENVSGSMDFQDKVIEIVPDDQLRLVFTCCHPLLSRNARVALTLREVCGLSTDEIARAYLTETSTIAQRIVRAKAKIRSDSIPYEIPSAQELPLRLDAVLEVIYLMYSEGYAATSGPSMLRSDLSREAIRLAGELSELLPEPEVLGLCGLMQLQESRRKARIDADGNIVLLNDQDRSLWDRRAITAGIDCMNQAFRFGQIGPYTIQAAIAAVHATAARAQDTNWKRILDLYDLLLDMQPSPIVELNKAVAAAMCHGPETGLSLVDNLLSRGELTKYHLTYAARADFCAQSGRYTDALADYQRAFELAQQEPEQRFLQNRIRKIMKLL
ncbi:RNA polymerase sigma factor [Spirochaeta dissipatitropha]